MSSSQHSQNLNDAEPVQRGRGACRDLEATRNDERGSSLVEYALLLALIAVLAIGGLSAFGTGSGGLIDRSSDSIVSAG